MKSFIKECVAVIKGDDAEAVGQRILRQADSGLKTQIAVMNGDTIRYEDAVENATEALRLARVNNGEVIADRDLYVETLIKRKNQLTKATEELESHLETLEFLKETLSSFDKEEKA